MTSETPTRSVAAVRFKLREPFNGLSHLIGAALGIAALALLVTLARGKPWALKVGGALRIDEARLLEWARARSQHAENLEKRARAGLGLVHSAQKTVRIRPRGASRAVRR